MKAFLKAIASGEASQSGSTPATPMPLSSNVFKLKLLTATWSFLMLQGIAVAFFKSRGLDLSQIYALTAAMSLTLGVLEIPTGMLSDLVGRKFTLVLAAVFKGIGGTLIAYGGAGFKELLVAYICIGVANSLYSGTDLSLLYESTPGLSQPERASQMASFYFIALSSLTLAVVLGGAFAFMSFDWIARVNCIVIWSSLVITLTLREPASPQVGEARLTGVKKWQEFKRSVRAVFVTLFSPTSPLLGPTLLSVLYAFAAIIAGIAFQNRWLELGQSVAFSGYASAAVALLGSVFGKKAGALQTRFGKPALLLMVGCIPVLGFAGGALPVLWLTLVGAGLLECVRAFAMITLAAEVNEGIGNSARATANSILSFSTRSFVALFAPAWGYAVGALGASASFLGLAVLYCLPLFLVLRRVLLARRRAGGKQASV